MDKPSRFAALLFVASSLFAQRAYADDAHPPAPPAADAVAPEGAPGLPTQISVMAGATQWLLLRGGNIAAEAKVGRLAFEISHGQGLDLNQVPSLALTSAERDAGARVRVPWTTGFGVGVRLTENLHLLVEAKAHRYEVSGRDANAEARYTTFSVGPSAFYTIQVHKGFFLQPNVRWWPNVGSTLSGGRVLIKQPDGTTYDHKAHDFGLFANMNVGYTFS